MRDDFLRHVDLHVVGMLVLILPFVAVIFGLELRHRAGVVTLQSSTLFVLLMAAFNAASLFGPIGYTIFHTFDRISQQGRVPARFFLWNCTLIEVLSSIVAGIFLLIHAL